MIDSILYIDDDDDDREVFTETIERLFHGTRVLTVSDGLQGLQLLAQLDALPSLVFLDVNMPKFSGREFMTELRKDDKFANLRIVVYTTTIRPSDADEFIRLGAWKVLTKPASLTELESMLQKLIA